MGEQALVREQAGQSLDEDIFWKENFQNRDKYMQVCVCLYYSTKRKYLQVYVCLHQNRIRAGIGVLTRLKYMPIKQVYTCLG